MCKHRNLLFLFQLRLTSGLYVVIMNERPPQYFFVKIKSSCLKGRNAASEKERPRQKTRTQDWYIWHHTFSIHVVILHSKLHLVFLWQGWSGPLLNEKPLAPRAVPKAASYMTANFFWLSTCFMVVETVCLYKIRKALLSSSSSHFTRTVSAAPLSTQMHPAYKISKVNI